MPIPLIHQTDLFRPHADPDDHWDLACVYALAKQGEFDLKGVLIDYPPRAHHQPDAQAVAQMNYIHGLSVPFVVGSSILMQNRRETQVDAPAQERNGVEFLLRTLRESSEPVVIQIVGSCRDVALAANLAPVLFREKCRAIYMNAGSGTQKGSTELEYNVSLNAQSYAAIFDIDCPLYWLPCISETAAEQVVREYATLYSFQQKAILQTLPPLLQNYFAFMLGRFESTNWLHALREADFSEVLQVKGEVFRDMWCTGGILHIAGLTVTGDGHIVPLEAAGDASVFFFDPIEVRCDDRGLTTWQHSEKEDNRFIFHVRNLAAYQEAMAQAMKTLLASSVSIPQRL